MWLSAFEDAIDAKTERIYLSPYATGGQQGQRWWKTTTPTKTMTTTTLCFDSSETARPTANDNLLTGKLTQLLHISVTAWRVFGDVAHLSSSSFLYVSKNRDRGIGLAKSIADGIKYWLALYCGVCEINRLLPSTPTTRRIYKYFGVRVFIVLLLLFSHRSFHS